MKNLVRIHYLVITVLTENTYHRGELYNNSPAHSESIIHTRQRWPNEWPRILVVRNFIIFGVSPRTSGLSRKIIKINLILT